MFHVVFQEQEQVRTYPDNRGFSWHVKNGEKRKTSEEIVSNPVEYVQ